MDKINDHLIELENIQLSSSCDMSATLVIIPTINDYFTIVGQQKGKEGMDVYVSKTEFLAMFAGDIKQLRMGKNYWRSNGALLIVRDDRKVSISVSLSECQEKLIECGLLRSDEVCIAS